MGVSQYNLGKRHAKDGIRAMAHRKLRRYDSQHAQESYNRGYSDGIKERGSIRMDYSNPLNDRVMES